MIHLSNNFPYPISYFTVDYDLWLETEGAINWVLEFLSRKAIEPPNIDELIEQETVDNKYGRNTNMYLRMFETACEMIQEERQETKKKRL